MGEVKDIHARAGAVRNDGSFTKGSEDEQERPL